MGIYSKIIDIQKLGQAWERVRKNKPACGVDNVTCEMFEERRREEIKQLNIELAEHRYESLPVRLTTIYKGEKARRIALLKKHVCIPPGTVGAGGSEADRGKDERKAGTVGAADGYRGLFRQYTP